ncbi:MAG: ABC transporter substrate-binding protein [Leptospirales bacterium]
MNSIMIIKERNSHINYRISTKSINITNLIHSSGYLRIKKIGIVLTLGAVLFIQIACNFSSSIENSNNTISMALKEPLESLDPVFAVDASSGILISLLFRRLYTTDLEGKVIADLVRKEKLSGNFVILHLKTEPYKDQFGGYYISATDVRESLLRLKNSGRQLWLTENFSDVHVMDRFVVKIELVSKSGISAKAIWEKQKSLFTLPQTSIFDYDFWEKRKKYRSPSFFTLFENTRNRIVLRGGTNKKLVFHIINDDAGRWFYFKRNLLDFYNASGVFRFGNYNKKKYSMIVRPQLVVLYGAMVAPPEGEHLLANRKFRRALNYRIDRENLCQKILLGAYESADYPVPHILAGKLKPYFTFQAEYSVPELKQNEPIIIYTPSDRERQLVARYFSATIKKMGYTSKIKVVDLATLIRLNNSGMPGIYMFKWLADYPHAENFLLPLFHSNNKGSGGNRAHFENHKVDNIFDTRVLTHKNATVAQNIIRADAPWVFVGFSRQFIFVNSEKKIIPPVIYTGWSKESFGW